jgi:hypothetical protein
MIDIKKSLYEKFDNYILWNIDDFLYGTPKNNYTKVINEINNYYFYNLLDFLKTELCSECDLTTHSFMGFCRECFPSEIREILKEQDNLEYKFCDICEQLELHDYNSCIYCEPYNIIIDNRKLY